MKIFGKLAPNPVFLSIFGVDIFWYSICLISGMLLALYLAQRIMRERKMNTDISYDVFLFSVAFGVVGARVYHVLSQIEYYKNHTSQILNFRSGGLGIYGGVIFGIFGMWIATKIKKVKFSDALNITAIVLPLGQAIGRFGNFFNQELFGFPTDLPWGIYIKPINRPLKNLSSEYFHPLFLYESLFSLGLFLFLYFNRKKLYRFSMSIFLIGYGFWRFLAEFLRNTETPTWIFRLEQWVSLFTILTGVVILFIVKSQKNEKRE